MRWRLGTLFRGLPISLGTRLTVLLALVFALVLAVVGTVLVEQVRSALDQQILDRLAGEAALLSERLSLEATSTQWVSIIHRQMARSPSLQVELLDPTGRRVDVWNPISKLPLPRYLPEVQLNVGANHAMALVAYPIDSGGFRLGAVVVAASLGTVNAYLADLSRRVLEAGGLGLVLAIVGSMLMTRRALEPLQKVAATAGEISSSEDLQRRLPAQGPFDEVRALSESFNAMLGRLEVAFDRQTRFVADASHELRTPLMVVKGYADLLDRWGQEEPAVRQEAVEAIQREASRMTRLVQDLLILADTDRGMDCTPSTVDVTTLLEEVRAEIEVIRPDRTATLDTARAFWSPPTPTACASCCGSWSTMRSATPATAVGSTSRPAPRPTGSRSGWRTTGSASPPRTSRTSSSASTGWKRPAPARRGGRAWAFPSPRPSWPPWGGRSGPPASRGARSSPCACTGRQCRDEPRSIRICPSWCMSCCSR